MAKLVALDVEETSGVDYPAHLDNGWIVMKASMSETEQSVGTPDEKPVAEAPADEEKAAEPTPEEVIATLEAKVAELQDKLNEKEAAQCAEPQAEDKPEENPFAKALADAPEPLAKAFAELEKRAANAESELAKAADEKDSADAEAFVKSLDRLALEDDAADLVKMVRREAPELAKQVEQVLTTVNGQVESAGLFAELGKASAPSNDGNADAQLHALAKAKSESDSIPFAKAYSEVLKTDKGKELYGQHLNEVRG